MIISLKLMRSIAVSIIAGTLVLASNVSAEGKKSPFAAGPRTIASRERVTVLIDREITDGKRFIVLKISVPTDSEVKAFLLSDPPRVVVDFEGASIKKSEEFAAPDNEVIKQVRLGAHPSKIRFVLDMKRNTPPQYEWKAGKRQAIFKFFEGQVEAAAPAAPAPLIPSAAPAVTPPSAILPTLPPATPTLAPTTAPATAATTAPTTAPTIAPSHTPTLPPTAQPTMTPSATPKTTLSDLEPTTAANAPAAATAPAPSLPGDQAKQAATNLGDIEDSATQPKVPTTFSIKGYKFEYAANKVPVLKILLNKPQAQAQISKVDEETYKIEIKDCGIADEDLELPQFPPHDFIGFVMVVAETVGKNTEVSISIEEDIVLGTVVNGNEIWVKKP